MTGALDPALPGSGAGSVPGDGQSDSLRGSGPAMHWARCPTDGLLHAIAPIDAKRAVARGYAETLCDHHLPVEVLVMQDVPPSSLCLPCVIGATADIPDPGRMGTAQ